jgi:transposase-like protein
MYSYEDRLRAVELYIRLGKRLKATIRQLGYPTKNALRGWYREHEQDHIRHFGISCGRFICRHWTYRPAYFSARTVLIATFYSSTLSPQGDRFRS